MRTSSLLRLGRSAALVAAGLLAFGPAAPAAADLVDCLAAVVNGQPVTLVDVRIADAFGIYREEGAAGPSDRLFRVLERLVDQKTVVQFAGANIVLPESEVQAALRALLDRLEPAAVQERLARFGLDLDDVLRALEEKLVFRRIIDLRFSRSVSVSLQEMEDYYQRVYAGDPARRGFQAEPMIALLQEIEARIRQDKIDAQAALWIRSLRGQAEVEFRYDWLRMISPDKE
jgi:parvulin-like peptidyl-prolyl isomerase